MHLSDLAGLFQSELFSLPNIVLYILLFIQVLKLLRPLLEKFEWGKRLFGAFDKGADFIREFSPLIYDIIEAAQKKGLLKESKSTAFLKLLQAEAQKQGIILTAEQEAKAQLIAAGKAAFDHLPQGSFIVPSAIVQEETK